LSNSGACHEDEMKIWSLWSKEINNIMVEANKEFLSQMGSKQSQNFKALLKNVWMDR